MGIVRNTLPLYGTCKYIPFVVCNDEFCSSSQTKNTYIPVHFSFNQNHSQKLSSLSKSNSIEFLYMSDWLENQSIIIIDHCLFSLIDNWKIISVFDHNSIVLFCDCCDQKLITLHFRVWSDCCVLSSCMRLISWYKLYSVHFSVCMWSKLFGSHSVVHIIH